MKFLVALLLLFSTVCLGQGVNLNNDQTNQFTQPGSGGGGQNVHLTTPEVKMSFGWGWNVFGQGFGRDIHIDQSNDCHAIGAGLFANDHADNCWLTGWNNYVSANQGSASGHMAWSRIEGCEAFAMGGFNTSNGTGDPYGTSQVERCMFKQTTTPNQNSQLASSAQAGGVLHSTALTLQPQSTMHAHGIAVARDPATGTSCSWQFDALAKKGATDASTVLVGSRVTQDFCDAAASGWTFLVAADGNLGAIAMTFRGDRMVHINADVAAIENVGGTTLVGTTGTPPPPPPSGGCTVSTAGAVIHAGQGQLVDQACDIWTISAHADGIGAIMRNGVQMCGLYGPQATWTGSRVEMTYENGARFYWSGTDCNRIWF